MPIKEKMINCHFKGLYKIQSTTGWPLLNKTVILMLHVRV